MTYPSAAVAVETLQTASVVCGAGEAIWSGRTRAIFGLGGVEVCGSVNEGDLERVSVECDVVVEKLSDCPMESDGAHETCHGLRGRALGHLPGRICLVHGVVVAIAVSYCQLAHALCVRLVQRTAVIANACAAGHGQSPGPVLVLHLCGLHLSGRRHGTGPRVRDQDAQSAQDGREGRRAPRGGRSRSCRFVLGLRGGAARRLPWRASGNVSHVRHFPSSSAHLFLLQLQLLRLEQLARHAHRAVLRTQH
jgi:hypothetical protein